MDFTSGGELGSVTAESIAEEEQCDTEKMKIEEGEGFRGKQR